MREVPAYGMPGSWDRDWRVDDGLEASRTFENFRELSKKFERFREGSRRFDTTEGCVRAEGGVAGQLWM